MLKKILTSILLIASIQLAHSELTFNLKGNEISNEVFVQKNSDTPFNLSTYQTNETVHLNWGIMEGHKLYKDKIEINANGAELNTYTLPSGTPYNDEVYGNVEVYEQELHIPIDLQFAHENSSLEVTYQGCKEGFCYPPTTTTIHLTKWGEAPCDKATEQNKPHDIKVTEPENPIQKDQSISKTIVVFFLLGLGISLTPCVLPMYPILSSIIFSSTAAKTSRSVLLAISYTQGVAVTYTGLGLLVATMGMQFQVAMQHPYVLSSIALLFLFLSMSMLGVFNLQLPSSLQVKLNEMSNKQKGGSVFGVFVMGAISGLVCSPCTTAPLSGALMFVAQTGDVTTGAMALYALAVGMSLPLIGLAVFGSKALPKAGIWMEFIKKAFGLALLGMSAYFLTKSFNNYEVHIWVTFGALLSLSLLHARNIFRPESLTRTLLMGAAIISLTLTTLQTEKLLNPETITSTRLSFTKVQTLDELQEHLNKAKLEGRPVMLDIYADWCSSCKRLEMITFADADVHNKLQGHKLLKVDISRNSSDNDKIMKHLGILGLPSIEFWSAKGGHLKESRVSGFINPADFIITIEKAK